MGACIPRVDRRADMTVHSGNTRPSAPASAAAPQGCRYLAQIVPFDEGERLAQAMENWFGASASDSPFALELAGTRREQGFVLRASSEEQLTLLCKQFEAQYPQAEIHRIAPGADPLVLQPGEHALVGCFALAQPSWMPLKTFPGKALAEPGTDPLPSLLAAMETVGPGERVICQLALVRAPDTWIAPAIRKAVEHPLQRERDQVAATRKGETSDRGRGVLLLVGLSGIVAYLLVSRWYRDHAWLPLSLMAASLVAAVIFGLWWWIRRVGAGEEVYDMKLVAEKLQRAAFYTQLRVIVIGQEATSPKERLRVHLAGLEVAYRQFSLASANSLSLKRTRWLSAHQRQAFSLPSAAHAFPYHHPLRRIFARGWSSCICNGLELAGLFHLPQERSDLPLVRRISVKHLLFSPEVAHQVLHAQAPLPPVAIGTSQHRGHSVRVALPYATLFSHKLLVGRSRYGKSVLLQLLLCGAMAPVSGNTKQPGVFCIDPHKDLVFDILKSVPWGRANDVLLFDFTNGAHPVGLNPLDASMGLSRDQMAASCISCFERIWEKYWGPRMAFFLKAIVLLLITLNFKLCAEGRAQEQYTLLDINPILQYKDYAILVLTGLDARESWHQELLAFFQHTYWSLPTNSSFRQEIIMPILSKMGVFADNVQLRRIFGQAVTTAPVHQAVTQGKIVLCALSSRDMEEAAVNILGSTLINLLHYAFTRQHDIPFGERRQCFVAVDELQNFSGSAFDKLMSEDGKWGCAGLFTTQNLRRLNEVKEGLLELLLSNCDNLFAFNVSAADAKLLEAEFQEKVSQKHILSQPRLHCYARLSLPGVPVQFASVSLDQPASWSQAQSRHALSQEIVRGTQARLLSAAEADRRHEAHLAQFLDVQDFAERIKRAAAGIAANRRRRQEEEQREADRRAEQMARVAQSATMPLPTPPRPGGTGGQPKTHRLPLTLTPSDETEQGPAASPGQATRATPAPLAPPDDDDDDDEADHADQPGGRGRSHSRSRRKGRLKGTPPEGVPLEGLSPPQSDEQRPLPPAHRGTGWSGEGRERERSA